MGRNTASGEIIAAVIFRPFADDSEGVSDMELVFAATRRGYERTKLCICIQNSVLLRTYMGEVSTHAGVRYAFCSEDLKSPMRIVRGLQRQSRPG